MAGDYAFEHRTSSEGSPQSNGKLENAVKTTKRMTEKAVAAAADPYLGFSYFRNTPAQGLNSSPAQRLFGRRTKTLLPTSGRIMGRKTNENKENKCSFNTEQEEFKTFEER